MTDYEIALQKVKDPNALSGDLDYHTRFQQAEIRCEIAKHPNASLTAMLLLAPDFMEEVLQNKSLLSRLEEPVQGREMRNHAKGLTALLDHPQTPQHICLAIFGWVERRNEIDLTYHLLLNDAGRAQLKKRGYSDNFTVQAKCLKHPYFPVEQLEPFLLGVVPRFRWGASLHPNAPKKMIDLLVRMGSSRDLDTCDPEKSAWIDPKEIDEIYHLGYWAQFVSAQNPHTSVDALNVLSKSLYPDVRCLVAANQNITVQIAFEISRDEENKVIEALASNPKTPPELLESYAKKFYLAPFVASNPATPIGSLRYLSRFQEALVLSGIAANPSSDEEALLEVVAHKNQRVAHTLAAENPSITEKIAMLLCKNEESDVRVALASNVKIPPKVLIEMAKDPESRVRRLVVRHLNTPPKALEILSKERLREIRTLAENHPNNRSFMALTSQLIELARALLKETEEKNLLPDDVAQRTLMTIEAIAPQGFTPEKTRPVLGPLSEALLQKRDDPLYEFLGNLALDFTKDPKGEDGISLGLLRENAIDAWKRLGVTSVTASKRVDKILGISEQ